jgi:flagellar biosynthesis protein
MEADIPSGPAAVSNEKPKQAIAISYDPESDKAPRVVASGRGLVAENIIALARQSDVPIHEDTVLTQALLQVDIEEVIPPDLYAVVAQLLAFVYRLREKKATGL